MTDDDTELPSDREAGSIGARIADDPSAATAMTADFYRGEVDRTTTWRARLDQTTNWAVVVVAAILTWAFSSSENPHYVILIGVFGITAFLAMEATRYREYDIWRNRVRTLQSELIADVLALDRSPGADWQTRLSEELRDPGFEITFPQALSHRLRRSYLALLLILLVAWLARITVFEPSEPWRRTASIFLIPGDVVVALVGVFYVLVVGITVWSARDERVREFQE
jgi:uncharacterized membrane protein